VISPLLQKEKKKRVRFREEQVLVLDQSSASASSELAPQLKHLTKQMSSMQIKFAKDLN
jgi:hypothetical protein